MRIRMIVTDLDRTLLRSDKTISEYTARILSACRQKGIQVAFATARSENSCRSFTDLIHPDAIVSNGGARVRMGEKTVYRRAMSLETTNALLLRCLQQPSVGYITADTDKGYFVNYPVDESNASWAEYLPAYPMDFSQGLDGDAYKITVQFPDDAAAYAVASGFPTVSITKFTGENWYRFADKEADKRNGVAALAAHLGIALGDIAAFGDDHSDIEMLRACGTGVAVSNAIGEVKEIADVICAANDCDGVAKWMEDNVLCG